MSVFQISVLQSTKTLLFFSNKMFDFFSLINSLELKILLLAILQSCPSPPPPGVAKLSYQQKQSEFNITKTIG